MYARVRVILVSSMLEVVQSFRIGQRLRLRGILMEVFLSTFLVNYADFELVDGA